MELPSRPTRITPAFGKQYMIRAFQECLSDGKPSDFGSSQMEETTHYFKRWEGQPACVYCGSPDVKRWDHLIAVSEFGLSRMGNLVLACARCDDSKGNRPYDEWMRGPAKYSPASRGDIPNVEARIRRIEGFVQRYGTRPVPLEERLSPSELREHEGIVRTLQSVYRRANRLVDNFRERTGAE